MTDNPLCAIIIIIAIVFLIMIMFSKNKSIYTFDKEGYASKWNYPYRNWSYSYPYRKWSYRYPRYYLSYQWGGKYPYVSAYDSPYGHWW